MSNQIYKDPSSGIDLIRIVQPDKNNPCSCAGCYYRKKDWGGACFRPQVQSEPIPCSKMVFGKRIFFIYISAFPCKSVPK